MPRPVVVYKTRPQRPEPSKPSRSQLLRQLFTGRPLATRETKADDGSRRKSRLVRSLSILAGSIPSRQGTDTAPPTQPRREALPSKKPGAKTHHPSFSTKPFPQPPKGDDRIDDTEIQGMTWEDVWAEIEDIGQSITMTNDQASDITGHFCDLFHGMHTTYGKVALKRPRVKHQNYNKGDVRRFLREAKTWKDLRHNYILQFIGVCRIGDYLYMVSPLVENGTLNVYLENHPEADRLRLLHETAEAIAYLHRQKVIHGDIKSNNILVSNDIHALLCDFGLTRLSSHSTSTALKGAGTARWQSPELLLSGGGKSTESDTWAFGITISEVLSGTIPYADYEQDAGAMIALLQRDERPTTNPMFSPTGTPYYPAWRVAMYCWAKNPTKRPSMEEVMAMLAPTELRDRTQQVQDSVKTVTNIMSHVQISESNTSPRTSVGEEVEQAEDDRPGDGSQSFEDDEDTFCYCGGCSDGSVVRCESGSECPLQWFHVACLGIEDFRWPWYCLDCEAKLRGT